MKIYYLFVKPCDNGYFNSFYAFFLPFQFCCRRSCSSSSADLYKNAADSLYPDINCFMVVTSLELS